MKLKSVTCIAFGAIICSLLFAEVSIIQNTNGNYVGTLFAYKEYPQNEFWTKYSNNPLRISLNEIGDLYLDGKPSLAINPLTGYPEVVWSKFDGNDYEVVYSYFNGSNWSSLEYLTNNDFNELNPNIAFSDEGTLKVAWWSDEPSPQVYYKIRKSNYGWSTTLRISDTSESCRFPNITPLLDSSYLGFEQTFFNIKNIIIASILDGPDPLPTLSSKTTIGFGNYEPNSEPTPHSTDGHLWAEWIYDDNYLAWSEKISDQWTVQRYEPYYGYDDIPRARLYIKMKVLSGQ